MFVALRIAEEDKNRYNDQMRGYQPPEEEPEKEESPKKDANLPKRSPSAYAFFHQRRFRLVKAEHPEAKSTEIMKIIAGLWQKLTDDEKKPYVEEAAVAKAKYDIAKSEYKRSECLQVNAHRVWESKQHEEEQAGGDDDDDDDDDEEDDEDDDDEGDDELTEEPRMCLPSHAFC